MCLDPAFSWTCCVCVLHFVGPTLQCVKINAQLFPAETQDEISLNAPFQWKLGVCIYYSSCSSPFFVFFIDQTQNMTIHVLETQQTHQPKTMKPKPYELNPCKKKKKKKKKRKRKSQTQQLIKQSNLTNGTNQTDLPSKRNRSNPANPPSINPSTATEFRSTHQTPADQPIHYHWVPKSNLSNPLSINPSNPPPINPSTTTEFPNQETKTLVLHKTKLHGRKREEAPPRAYRREREIDFYWERSKKIK